MSPLFLKPPPVETDFSLHVIETNVQVVNVGSVLHLRSERVVFLYRACRLDVECSHNWSVHAIQTQGDRTTARCRGSQVILFGSTGKVDTAKTDVLTVTKISDIHITTACRGRHIGNHTRILNTHFGTLQSVAPCHGLRLNTLVGIQPMQLLNGLLIQPIRHQLDGSVALILDLRCRDAAALMMHECSSTALSGSRS